MATRRNKAGILAYCQDRQSKLGAQTVLDAYLYYEEEMSISEICLLTGQPYRTVDSHIYRVQRGYRRAQALA